jgi:uridine phosphorylase
VYRIIYLWMPPVEKELIVPKKGKKELPLGPVAAMVAIEQDLPLVLRANGNEGTAKSRILTSHVYVGSDAGRGATIVGPMLGAPYAVLVLEKLIALGAKKVVFFGWCGSFQSQIKTGDLIIPTGARVGEGTSPYYRNDETPTPADEIVEAVVRGCRTVGRSFHQGIVWSTDAPYRETRDKVTALQKDGVLGVDMEVSALFTVARFRGVALGALLVVSDELASLTWKPGFKSQRFNEERIKAAGILAAACAYLRDKGTADE